MAEKDLVSKEYIEHKGLFNFSTVYSFAHSWFRENQYGVNEDKYAEKVTRNKRKIDIEWKAMKRLSDYFKIEYKVVFEVKEMTEVEAEIDGKKEKMNQGEIKITITSSLIMDYQSKWDTSPFNRLMRDIYNKYIIPSRVEEKEDEVRTDLTQFKESLKDLLTMLGRR